MREHGEDTDDEDDQPSRRLDNEDENDRYLPHRGQEDTYESEG